MDLAHSVEAMAADIPAKATGALPGQASPFRVSDDK
jgi:hypothetical protein